MLPTEILLEEYRTLREESLTAMKNMIAVLSFGIAAVGAVFSFALAKQASTFSSLILIFGLPSLAWCVLVIWLGEYRRMQRVGTFLRKLENTINVRAVEDKISSCPTNMLLSWETHLRADRVHMSLPYNTIVSLFVATSAISLAIGILTMPATNLPIALTYMRCIAIGVGAAVHGVVLLYVLWRMGVWRG